MKILQHIKDVIAVNKMEKLEFGIKFIGNKDDIAMVKEIVKSKEFRDKYYIKQVCKEIYDNVKCEKYTYIKK